MVVNTKFLFAIFICTLSVLDGCSKYSEVAEYADSNKVVRITVLDPTDCDFARHIKIKITTFGKEFGPYDLELLDCTKTFSYRDYKLSENKRWVVLAENVDDSPANVIIAVDLVNKIVVDESSGFPDEVFELIAAVDTQNVNAND